MVDCYLADLMKVRQVLAAAGREWPIRWADLVRSAGSAAAAARASSDGYNH